MKRIVAASVVLLACVACSKTPSEPAPVDRPSAAATTTASAITSATAAASAAPASSAAKTGPDDVAFDAPASWQSVPNPNAMRKATYKIPKAAGDADDAELTFSSASGGVDPNVNRWAKQFGDAKPATEKRKVNGLDVTVVEIKGQYAGGGPAMMGSAPGEAKSDWMLLGAIVDAGDKQHFLKMVGPAKTVNAAKKDFDKVVASLRAK
jgi:hypothetical protein